MKFRLLALAAGLLCGAAVAADGVVNVKLIAFNDFHGNLRPPGSGIRVTDPNDPSKSIVVPAGGSEYLARYIRELKAKNPNHVVVSAGDLVGASPLISALFHDEPTIRAMNEMGLEFNAVGNHEFDRGAAELLRKQNGGCHKDGCVDGDFPGAKFKFLAANVVVKDTGKTLFPAYAIKRFDNIPVAFIGMTLKGTPGIVNQAGTRGLEFGDEAETVNKLVPELKAQGVNAIVVLVHEGGMQAPGGGINDCKGLSGALLGIVKRFDPAVDVVVSGHTHQPYNCVIDNKRVTSAQSFGRLVTEIDLKLDARTGDVIQHDATNLIVRSEGEKDPAQTALIERYARLAAPIENRPVGKVRGFLAGRGINENGESPLGRLIADAHWAAMSGPEYGRAELAVANLGGIRADLKPAEDGSVNYGQLYTTQPFGNNLVTISLRGADLIELLEQQFRDDGFEPLQWSSTLFYRYNPKAPQGSRVDVESIRIRGQAIDRDRYYRIATTTFLAGGADGFSVFKKARQLATGPIDLDALVDYIKAGQALTQDDAPRMVKE